MHCPECVKEARATAPRTKPAILTSLRSSDRPVVTYSIIAICVVLYVAQIIPGSPVTNALVYYPPFTAIEPWRMITSLFVHSPGSFFHILFNMYSLFVFGPILERGLGRLRFIALYLLSGLGGSVGVLLLSPGTPVLGASGAIFGLLGAFFVINRRLGGNNIQLIIVIGLNLALGFIVPNVAWQAHLGGLVVGALVALVYLRTRRSDQKNTQIILTAAVFTGLVLVSLARIYIF